jgi:hypothetical protein
MVMSCTITTIPPLGCEFTASFGGGAGGPAGSAAGGGDLALYDGATQVGSITGASMTAESLDADLDGCTDTAEHQTAAGSQTSGGRRDSRNFWDFFDTPQPNASPARNGAVDIDDLFRVVGRFAATGDPEANPLASPPKTGYHPAFDRGGQDGPNRWNLAPADGVIDVDDVFDLVSQFAHSCA